MIKRHLIDETHTLLQDDECFQFGTDAVLLAGCIRCRQKMVGAELGTGTGIVPLLLSIHKSFEKIYAIEIQRDSARLARQNMAENGFEEKVEIIEGDLKDGKKLIGRECDFVFSNPPYMRKGSGEHNRDERRGIARHEVLCDLTDVCRTASELLKEKGSFYVVYRAVRMAELFSVMRQFRLEPKALIPVTPTPDSEPELILVRGVKGANPDLICRQNFVIQTPSGERTPECQELYRTGHLSWGRGE